jgi:hypothetical protein
MSLEYTYVCMYVCMYVYVYLIVLSAQAAVVVKAVERSSAGAVWFTRCDADV